MKATRNTFQTQIIVFKQQLTHMAMWWAKSPLLSHNCTVDIFLAVFLTNTSLLDYRETCSYLQYVGNITCMIVFELAKMVGV